MTHRLVPNRIDLLYRPLRLPVQCRAVRPLGWPTCQWDKFAPPPCVTERTWSFLTFFLFFFWRRKLTWSFFVTSFCTDSCRGNCPLCPWFQILRCLFRMGSCVKDAFAVVVPVSFCGWSGPAEEEDFGPWDQIRPLWCWSRPGNRLGPFWHSGWADLTWRYQQKLMLCTELSCGVPRGYVASPVTDDRDNMPWQPNHLRFVFRVLYSNQVYLRAALTLYIDQLWYSFRSIYSIRFIMYDFLALSIYI